MKASEAKAIAESTGCKGCHDIAEELEMADAIARSLQRKVIAAQGTKRQATGKASEQVRAVIEEWRRVFPEHIDKAAEPGSKRWEKIEQRLRGGCTFEQCKLAPTGAKTSPWHQRQNKDKALLTDINHIFFSEKIVEELAGRARGQVPDNYDGPRGAAEILNRLEGVKRMRDDEWQALCPAHDDGTASLRIGQGEKGAVLRCMAGCDTEQVLAAIDLTMPALFDRPQDEPPVRLSKPPKRIDPLPTMQQLAAYQQALASNPILLERLGAVRRWTLPTLERLGVGWDARAKRLLFPITDAQGDLVQVVNYSPRPAADRRKIDALRGRPRDLWPAPESLVEPEILLVEGEPDAISGHELGMAAVAVPGASTWKPAWSGRFEGRRVLICMDCDKEGRDAARRAFDALRPVVPYVRIIDLDVTRHDRYDLSDFLFDGGTVEQLRHPGLEVVAA